MSDDRRGLAALLLIVQCGLYLLAALGLLTYARLSAASGLLLVPEVLAFTGPLLLALLAVGVLHGWRAARIGVDIWQAITLLGTAFSVVVSRGAALTLTVELSGIVLPAAIVVLVHTPKSFTFDLRRGVVIALLLTTAIVHLSLVPEHLAAPPRLGVLFVLDAAGCLAVAVGAAREARWWRPAAAVLLAATILAYIVVILKRQESVDDVGVATKLVELLALALVIWPRSAPIRFKWIVAAATIVSSIVFSGSLAWAAALRPGADGSHGHAGAHLIAVAPPSDAQRAAAAKLVDDTRAGIARYADVSTAIADGYRPSTPPAAPTVHYVNKAYQRDGRILDPTRPEALVYANTRGGPLLLGALYMLPRANQTPPDVGGALTEWHTHVNLCFTLPRVAIDGFESVFGTCPVGSISAPTPPMLHVWTVANPAGPFADLSRAYVARLAWGT